jgi:hypothetical protein
MLINDIKVELMRFENLYEFIKPLTSHYILRYDLTDYKHLGQSIYFCVIDGSNYVLFAYCIDKKYKDYIKIEYSGKVCETLEQGGTTTVIAHVIGDTFLEEIIKKIA